MRAEEEAFVRTFIARDKRQRWLELLAASEKSRHKITQRLYNGPPGDFNPALVHELEHTDADGLFRHLTSLGAGQTCWIISADHHVDGTLENLREAVHATYGNARDGTVLICLPDKLAYVEAEMGRFILRCG